MSGEGHLPSSGLSAGLAVLIPLFLLIWMWGIKPGDTDPFRIPGLKLVDAEGRVRIEMSVEEGGPALRLSDEEGGVTAQFPPEREP